MNQLLAIRCYARVVETGSFTRAADSLGIPKATVSKLVIDLETHLKVMLLQRSTRKVAPTADGVAYYNGTASLVRELEDFDSEFTGAHVKPSGKIRVSVGGTTGRLILVPALPAFFALYPDIQIELGVSDRAVDLVDENIDCVIRGGDMTQPSVVARRIGSASWVTCATPQYLDTHGVPQHPNDLHSGYRIIGYHSARTDRAIPSRFAKGGEFIEIDGPYAISVNDGAARAAAGLGGMGILQIHTFTVRADLAAGRLLPVLADWVPAPYPFHVVYQPNRKLSSRLRVFIDWLVGVFADVT
ncbi:LysR family transcriptional regulator [Rugamonas sp.]|uniref:LysR family transcriptional regulator n=1 Tax=Rugamonas sp. TaxID=1926287 RepID=UPI0025EE6AE5|nr:LysR family transcriptional regulator [Rugamonas sp.]